MKYDGFLFGNGLSINLLSQLQKYVPKDKHYLFNIDNFLSNFVNNQISSREENKIFKLFYKKDNIENIKYFEQKKKIMATYYQTGNANIEYHFGKYLISEDQCPYDYSTIKSLFPPLYNIWFEILCEYLQYQQLNPYIQNFENSVKSSLSSTPKIFTTNFDRLMDKLNPQHLHGKFIENYSKADQLVLKFTDNGKSFYHKCLWGWNGIGKLFFIDEISKIDGYKKYFNFDFFYDKDFHIEHLLVYGMGFQKSGYMNDLSKYKPKYNAPTFGGIIDEHILAYLHVLQNQNRLEHITFTYYEDKELDYFKELTKYKDFPLSNVHFESSQNFQFLVS